MLQKYRRKRGIRMYDTFKNVLKEKGISMYRAALNAGIQPSDIYSAVRGDRKFYDGWKHRISKALEMDPEDVFPDEEDKEVK
jgi:lambda repressor-like predicted transcriptional regulator